MDHAGSLGIGTLILFVALVLVAAIAAFVLITTNVDAERAALATGAHTRSQVVTGVQVMEVSASDGSDGDLDVARQILRLRPGSGGVNLKDAILAFNLYDGAMILKYRGPGGIDAVDVDDGYFTYRDVPVIGLLASGLNLSLDPYDADIGGVADHLWINSSSGEVVYVFTDGPVMPSNSRVLGSCSGLGAFNVSLGPSLGFLEGVEVSSDVCDGVGVFFAGRGEFTVEVVSGGSGFFIAEYVHRGDLFTEGLLQPGDVVELKYQLPREVIGNEEVSVRFMPFIGDPVTTEFITPEIIASERVYLYPVAASIR